MRVSPRFREGEISGRGGESSIMHDICMIVAFVAKDRGEDDTGVIIAKKYTTQPSPDDKPFI